MSAKLTPALRPLLPADGPALAAIFRSAVEELASEDYSPAQIDAWLSAAEDEAAFAAKLAQHLTLIATIAKEPVGFASLKDNGHVEMLYVRADVARRGIAGALLTALETLAAARGTELMTTDASDCARDFFAAHGYGAVRRNTVLVQDEWLGNTTMQKRLAKPARGPLQ